MRILGIETSCDDTAAAVLEDRTVLSNVAASQDALHAPYGGVVPELAARRHLETLSRTLRRALEEADTELDAVDAIAVTRGPGLVGSLLVGVSAARGLALRTGKPLFGVHHLEGHALSPLVRTELEMPFLSMVVSGGHSAIYLVREVGDYVEITATRDDSAGEAFDKGAKMLGLGYPGGKVVDDLARKGNARAVAFPRGRVKKDPLALTFSGLKTALWTFLCERDAPPPIEDLCASFQEAIVDVLVDRALAAVELAGTARVAVAGGVSANSRLREKMAAAIPGSVFPPMNLCTDNAAMIAYAAVRRLEKGLASDDLEVRSRLPLGRRLGTDDAAAAALRA